MITVIIKGSSFIIIIRLLLLDYTYIAIIHARIWVLARAAGVHHRAVFPVGRHLRERLKY